MTAVWRVKDINLGLWSHVEISAWSWLEWRSYVIKAQVTLTLWLFRGTSQFMMENKPANSKRQRAVHCTTNWERNWANPLPRFQVWRSRRSLHNLDATRAQIHHQRQTESLIFVFWDNLITSKKLSIEMETELVACSLSNVFSFPCTQDCWVHSDLALLDSK